MLPHTYFACTFHFHFVSSLNTRIYLCFHLIMQPRRSKVVPDPLVPPDKTAAAANAVSAKTTTPTSGAAIANSAVTRPRLFHVASPALAQPSTTPVSGTEPFSPGLNVYRCGGVTAAIAPQTRVLVDHHVTNTSAVVRLERVDYSKAMRAYRVYRQEGWTMPHTYQDFNTHSSSSSGSGGGGSGSDSANGATSGGSAGATAATSGSPGLAPAGPTAVMSPNGTAVANPITTPKKAMSSASPVNGGNSSNGSASTGPSLSACHSSRSSSGIAEMEAPSRCPAPWRVVLLRLFGAADMLLLAIAVACFLVVSSRARGSHVRLSQFDKGNFHAPSSALATLVSWVASVLAGLVTGGRSGGGEVGKQTSNSYSSTAAVQRADDGGSSAGALVSSGSAAAASYTQDTRAAALDTRIAFVLLFSSMLLLARRLSSAFTRVYVEEVLVMRGVGVQFSSYGIFNTLRYKRFVDLKMLRSLVIHDAFFRYQPIFFLSSSVENQAERVVYFSETLPRLAVLRPVMNGIRCVLYGEPEEGPSLAELEERWKTSSREVSDGEFFTEDSFAEDTMTTADEGHSSDGTDHEGEAEVK